MIDLLINFLYFIKSAYAGTGGPSDAELSVLLIISFLALILLLIVSLRYYQQWKTEHKRKKLFGNTVDDFEQDSDFELFQ